MVKETRSKKPDFRAFTIKGDGLLRNIKLTVGITQHSVENIKAAAAKQHSAVISTLSIRTKISSKAADISGLTVKNEAGIDMAHIDLFLPNAIRIENIPVEVIDKIEDVGYDCVIGMDILSCGDCSLSSQGNKTMFSFRVPSLGAEDFVQTHRKLHKKRTTITAATRNQPCPCGSGKKHKNCCGRIF